MQAPGTAELLGFFAFGLLGSVHCLGMCGPVVTLYADRLGDREDVSWFAMRQQFLFNAGRTVTYALVGAALGALGGVVVSAGAAVVGDLVRGVVGVLVGLGVVLAGVWYVFGRRVDVHVGSTGVFSRLVGSTASSLDEWVRGPRVAVLGAAHAALPCPILYPAFAYAFATGSPVRGGGALLALGLGTFPLVFAYGAALGSIGLGTRDRLHRVLGALMIALGTIPLLSGLTALGVPVPMHPIHEWVMP
jgi:sulfite exporter TauE/SafE